MHAVVTECGVGRLDGDEIALLDCPFPDLRAVIESDGSLECLARYPVGERVPVHGAQLCAPLGAPRAVWGVGLNYRSKAARAGRDIPSEPILYLAAPSAVLAPGGAVAHPGEVTAELDYEGEIAVVMGTRLYQADPADVWPAIAGLTAANDMTARDVMRRTSTPTLAKSFPGFCPMGGSVCSPDELDDPDRVPLRTWVNGVLHQEDTSDQMIFAIPELISRISRFAALEPGDIVLTGTPAGTGQDRGCFLVAGDDIRIEAGPVLPLLTTVYAAPG